MSRSERLRPLPWAAAACLVVAVQSGCTSALTAAYLRDGIWDTADHAEESDERPAAAVDETPPPTPALAADGERREAALEEAMARLTRLGPLDPAVEAAIVASLQRTEPEDWPVVVEEFAASLASAPVPAPPVPEPQPEPDHAADPTRAPSAEPAAEPAEPAPPAAGPPPVAAAASPPEPVDPVPSAPTEPDAPPAPAPLEVRTACFATTVRGWGDVVRFDADRFRPGQEVIVYVELDNLSAGSSPAGHTTCIDAVLRLVDDAGQPLHAWNFDPLAETRPVPRRDYFARYVVRMPDSLPAGPCRVEVEVTDSLTGTTATTTLPLEIAAGE